MFQRVCRRRFERVEMNGQTGGTASSAFPMCEWNQSELMEIGKSGYGCSTARSESRSQNGQDEQSVL
jgi:hypothetical protein